MSDKVLYTPEPPRFIVQVQRDGHWVDEIGFYEPYPAVNESRRLTLANPGEKCRVVERGDDGE